MAEIRSLGGALIDGRAMGRLPEVKGGFFSVSFIGGV